MKASGITAGGFHSCLKNTDAILFCLTGLPWKPDKRC